MKKALLAGLIASTSLTAAAQAHVRLLIRNTNWYYTRHHCYIGIPGTQISGGTGMGRGATELRVGGGDVTFAHQDIMGIWPPIAYHCPARLPGGPEVALDLTFGWVYVADGLCWTSGCVTYAQTFVAEGPEMVSVRSYVASPPKPIAVSLHEGGPEGPQVGGTKRFEAGTANWGLVFWQPGEAPTVAGKRYTIVLRSEDGSAWNPFVHSKGNCYDAGHAWFDGLPQPDTDLCLLISNPNDGYIRHLPVPNDPRDADQWSDLQNGQGFIARGRNLIFASVEADCGAPDEKQGGVHLVIRRGGPKGEQVGHRMSLAHMPGKNRSVRERGVPFGPDSIRLQIGQTYYAMLEYGEGDMPYVWRVRMRLYGEEAPGAHPTIASVWTGRVFQKSIEVTWRKGNRSKARIEYGKPGGPVLGTVEEMNEEGLAVMVGLEPDTLYQFRIIATSPHGYQYYSPWYLVRTRAEDGTLNTVEPMQRFGVFNPYFLPVADAPLSALPKRPVRATGRPVVLKNPGFESGPDGWTLTGNLQTRTFGTSKDIQPHEGTQMFGWLRVLPGRPDPDFYSEDRIVQKVRVAPGKWYQLSAWAVTAEPEWTGKQYVEETWGFPFFGSRCRDRVALIVDPKGAEDFTGVNSTQWYSTEGTWMLLTKCFQAHSETVTIGAAFCQRGQRAWDAAFVDDFGLTELEGPVH